MKEDGFEEYEKALKTCERMLAFELDIVQESNIFRKIGDIYLEIFKKGNDLQSCEHAIQAYQRSLAVYTQENYPHHRARARKAFPRLFWDDAYASGCFSRVRMRRASRHD